MKATSSHRGRFARAIVGLLLAAALLPGCLLTRPLGLVPTDGTEGRVVRSMITDQVWVGYYWGVLGVCEQAPDTNACMIVGNNHLARGIGIIAFTTPDYIQLDDDGYYTNESVKFCLETVRDTATLFTFQALDGTLLCLNNGIGGEDCFLREGKMTETAATLPPLTVPFCELRASGNFVSASVVNI